MLAKHKQNFLYETRKKQKNTYAKKKKKKKKKNTAKITSNVNKNFLIQNVSKNLLINTIIVINLIMFVD